MSYYILTISDDNLRGTCPCCSDSSDYSDWTPVGKRNMAPPKRRSQRQIKRKRFASYTDEEEEDSDDTEEGEEDDDDEKNKEDEKAENDEEEEKTNEQGRGTRRTQPKREKPKKKQQRPPPKKRKERRVVRNRVSLVEQNVYPSRAEGHLGNLIYGPFLSPLFSKSNLTKLCKGKKAIQQNLITDRVRRSVCPRGGGGGGVPHPGPAGEGGYPCRGVPHLGTPPPQSDLAGGGGYPTLGNRWST